MRIQSLDKVSDTDLLAQATAAAEHWERRVSQLDYHGELSGKRPTKRRKNRHSGQGVKDDAFYPVEAHSDLIGFRVVGGARDGDHYAYDGPVEPEWYGDATGTGRLYQRLADMAYEYKVMRGQHKGGRSSPCYRVVNGERIPLSGRKGKISKLLTFLLEDGTDVTHLFLDSDTGHVAEQRED